MHSKNSGPFENKLRSLEAFLISKEKGPDDALAVLGESTDPELIRRKLGILLDSDRIDDAVDLLESLPLEERWCDRAISAYVKKGDITKAKELIEWAKTKDDELLKNRCRLFYAESQYSRCWRVRQDGQRILPGVLSDDEINDLNDCISVLKPILAKVIAEEGISNEIESLAVQMFIEMSYLLNEREKTESLCDLLSTRTPLPLKLGQFALSRMCKIQKDAPVRYRTENPELLEAHVLAALLESELFGAHTMAFENIKKAEAFIKKASDKEDFCKATYQIAQHLDAEALHETRKLCAKLLAEESRFTLLVHADIFIREKNYGRANDCLSKAKDENDSNWLQIYASYLYHKGRRPEALKYMNMARLILPHPELLKSAAKLAFETEDYVLSIELLLQELKSEPDNLSHLNNIAAACFRKGDYKAAAGYYARLIEITREDLSHYLNLATCYVQTGDSQKAIEVYDIVCKRGDAPLEAFLSRAYLMRVNNPVEAFDSILPIKDKYWENPQYLQVVLNLSYKAGKEEYGHQAMLKLLELQREGKVSQEVIQAKTIEDLKIHMNEWNKKVEIINKNILVGKIPWLMADHWQNHSAYMGWYIRTQSFNWKMEEPLTCASYSVYLTNGFCVVRLSDDTTRLDVIECPARDTVIVADLSALITLHRLNLLEECLDYFGKIYVPQEYPVQLLHDSDNLGIPQRTRKTSAEAIKKVIDKGQIMIVEDAENKTLPFVHEYTLPEKEEGHYYRLIDLIKVAYDTGRLSEGKFNSLKSIADKPSGKDSEHPGLKRGQSVLVDLHTLYSICQIDADALMPILNTFRIHVSKPDQLRNSGEIIQVEAQEQLKAWNEQLRQLIRDRDEFIKAVHSSDPNLAEDSVYLASWQLAKERSVPLLVDDRVLQALAMNENRAVEHAFFGTDRLLMKLHEEKIIDSETMANAFLALIRWRYRFIVPTEDVLLVLAKRYKSHPPGQDLQDIALYVHDCMRDPGLFAGAENTTRKESMAAKLYATWTRMTADFLVAVWADSEFNEDAAIKITKWALSEFSPSLPRNISINSPHLSEVQHKVIISCFLALTFKIGDTSRASKALQIIAESFNMSETEYFKAVSEVVDHGI